MKYSNTTIKELTAQYRAVLKKCAILNAAVLMGAFVAMPAVADDLTQRTAVSSAENITLTDPTAKNLTATEDGAVIFNEGGLSVSNGTFENNETTTNGGVIAINSKTGANTVIENSKFINNKAEAVNGDSGAVSVQNGNTIITGSTFEGNTAGLGGALYAYTGNRHYVKVQIKDSVFKNNIGTTTTAGDEAGGAIVNVASGHRNDGDAGMWIDNTTFEGNKAVNANAGGGALFAGSEARTNVTNSKFIGNSSETVGGAIATRVAQNANGTKNKNWGFIDIIGTTFEGNTAAKTGGAIDNYFHDSDTKSGSVWVSKSAFNNNSAENGGAIYNHGDKDLNDLGGVMTIADTTFNGNKATSHGGAIYNEGKVDGSNARAEITFEGTTTFTGNTANGVKNDIYNGGIINIADGATVNFDGGIDADTTTAGSVLNIGDGSTIGLTLTSATDYTKIKSYEINYSGTSKLALTVATAGTYNVFDAQSVNYLSGSTPQPELTSNALYDFEAVMDQSSGIDSFTGTIVAKAKSTTQIAAETGVDQEAANALGALAQSDSVLSNQIALAAQQQLAAGDAAGVQKEVEKLNPHTAPTVQTVAQNNHEQVLGAVANRLAGFGRNGGDVNVDYGMWAQGLYNKTKLDGEFNGYTQGIAIGFDGLINDVYTVGLGYAYSNSNIKPTDRKLDVDGNTFLIYGQYKPNKFYVNGALSYARTNYKEKTNVYGVALDDKFDVDTYGVNAIAGYDLPYGITPEAGVRYTYVDDYKYNNGVSEVKVKSNDVLTGLAGFKYSVSATDNGLTIAPEIKAYATYDVLSDGNSSVVSIANAAPYSVAGKRLSRFGGEFGLGFKSSYKNVDLTLSYDLSVRRDFTSQTGSLKLKYNF